MAPSYGNLAEFTKMFNYHLKKMEETGIMRNIWSSIQSLTDKPEAQGMTFIQQYLQRLSSCQYTLIQERLPDTLDIMVPI
jgi:phosphoenolpyruvate-protein kinase (PTS system EI component)